MAILLNIETSGQIASVSISNNAEILNSTVNIEQKDHAAWLHSSINDMMKISSIRLEDINAVAVSIGPGSYTGLRVGLSAAKGFCYALNIPLITIGTLKIIANAIEKENGTLICPMIDARRMEVFAALYDNILTEIVAPHAEIIHENSFIEWLENQKIVFCGSGSIKLQKAVYHPNAIFNFHDDYRQSLALLAYNSYDGKVFPKLAYTEPLYIKEFYSPTRKPLI